MEPSGPTVPALRHLTEPGLPQTAQRIVYKLLSGSPTICSADPEGPAHCHSGDEDMSYSPRVADDELRARLNAAGAVVIEGPKACGKTETARQLAASSVLLDIDTAARQALAVDPSLVLDGATPRLIPSMSGKSSPRSGTTSAESLTIDAAPDSSSSPAHQFPMMTSAGTRVLGASRFYDCAP